MEDRRTYIYKSMCDKVNGRTEEEITFIKCRREENMEGQIKKLYL